MSLHALGPACKRTWFPSHATSCSRGAHRQMVSCAVTEEDRRHMRHALDLARRAEGKTHPNPAVGCVILKGQQAGLPSCWLRLVSMAPRRCQAPPTTCLHGLCIMQGAPGRRLTHTRPGMGRLWARGSTRRQACRMQRCTRCGPPGRMRRARRPTSAWSPATTLAARRPAAAPWSRPASSG